MVAEQVQQAAQPMAALTAQDQEGVVLMRTPPGQAQPPLGLAVITLAAAADTSQPLQAASALAAQAAVGQVVGV